VNAVWGGVVAFQFICATKIVDRLSKGVRAAPTDALLADLSPGAARGRSYSLNQSLSTLGGFAGSLACSAAMYITGNSYTLTFVTATVPALLAIALLVFAVKQPRLAAPPTAANALAARAAAPTAAQAVGAEDSLWDKLRAATRLSGKFYFSALVVSLLYLARFSESFVMLRARSVGTPLAMIPLIATANQLVQGLLTYPMGLVADLCSARVVLAIGWAMIILAHLVFATVPNALGSVLGFVLVAAHMSMTQANSKSMISQNLEPHQRGAGFAAFSVISGVALAAGNILAGWCNDVTVAKGLGMVGCFYSGFVWSSLSLALLLAYFAVYRSEDALATGKRDD
jgi:MFS family permease